MSCSAKGFTLVEGLVAMAALAILLMVALPAMTYAKAAVGSGSVRSELAASLLDAVRHSAITGTEVVVCPVAPSGECSGSTDWGGGWAVFADINRNRIPDPNETRLAGGKPLPADVRLRSTAGRTRLVFQPNGGNPGSNVTFTLCDTRGVEHATTLVLSKAGNLRSGKPSASAAWNCVHGN